MRASGVSASGTLDLLFICIGFLSLGSIPAKRSPIRPIEFGDPVVAIFAMIYWVKEPKNKETPFHMYVLHMPSIAPCSPFINYPISPLIATLGTTLSIIYNSPTVADPPVATVSVTAAMIAMVPSLGIDLLRDGL